MTDSDPNVNSTPETEDVFDLDRIRSLIELMKEHDLSEIDLRQDEQKIRLARGGAVAPVLAQPAPAPAPAAPAAGGESAPSQDDANIAVITSPMVGTFYARPNPKAATFVNVGDVIDTSTTVCIIEAMKVFNEIQAEVRGRIVAVLVDDEEPVEFGKPLFKVDTSS